MLLTVEEFKCVNMTSDVYFIGGPMNREVFVVSEDEGPYLPNEVKGTLGSVYKLTLSEDNKWFYRYCGRL